MEKTDKPLTRDALVSMQVINAKGQLVGKVKDLVFAVGQAGIALSVESKNGETQTFTWEEVQAASDFIILKPVTQTAYQPQQQQSTYQAQPTQTAAQQQSTPPVCSTCGKPLTWIPQYQRWYCYTEKKYV
jgi:sporulation protein YlmC with PRC-barrel domain